MKKQGRNLFAKALFSLLFSGVIVFWGFQVSAEEWTEEQLEVLKLVEAAWDSMVKGDIDALLADTAEGFLDWWPGDPSPFGRETAKAKYSRWFDGNKPVNYELKPVAINIIGDVANIYYHYKWNGDKMPATISGRQYSTWIKQDDKWKFIGSMGCSCNRRPYCN